MKELLAAGHIQISYSPYNSPIFVIKKRSGKWRLLIDLREINKAVKPLGPLQPGLPSPAAIPREWPLAVVDIKDCFYSVPLAPQDTEKFAFTIPSTNLKEPTTQYEFTVLPQGMANSPTMCQAYVQEILVPLREANPEAIIIHYMDDILLAHPKKECLQQLLKHTISLLASHQLVVAPEKIQTGSSIQYLGHTVTPTEIKRNPPKLKMENICTLNDFQKLIGSIQWLRGTVPISDALLQPLYDILKGDPALNSPREWTPEAITAAHQIMKLSQCAVQRIDPSQPIYATLLIDPPSLFASLYQEAGPLWWVYPDREKKAIPNRLEQQALLLLKASHTCRQTTGQLPVLTLNMHPSVAQELAQSSESWAILLTSHEVIPKGLPPSMRFWATIPITSPPKQISSEPVAGPNVFTDATKHQRAAVYIPSKNILKVFQTSFSSAQKNELAAIICAFQLLPSEPFNLITDSMYCYHAVSLLPQVDLSRSPSAVKDLLVRLQKLLVIREYPVYVLHVRSHVSSVGPIYQGKAIVDAALTSSPTSVFYSAPDAAHARFHLSAHTLRLLYSLTKDQARQIVRRCVACVPFRPPPRDQSVNPRGAAPNDLWQMDITHFQSSLIHVAVDTFSGFIMATLQPRESASSSIAHLLQCFATMGVPRALKTDNGPAYRATAFADFLIEFGIQHTTGIPYNPTGQAIVERANQTLKRTLLKQKGGVPGRLTAATLARSVYTCNFLHYRDDGTTPATRHYGGILKRPPHPGNTAHQGEGH